MALRQHNTQTRINQENENTRLTAKAAIIQPAKTLQKRAALGEVGNKLPSVTNSTNVTVKKAGVMAPPEAVAKKIAGVAPSKKENPAVKISQDKAAAKKQDTSVKNVRVDQDKVQASTDIAKSYSAKQFCIIDPDESSKNEPQMVTEYLHDIFSYLRELEMKFPVREHYLQGHETTPKMRIILINWLVEVHLNFKLYLETLYLCVSIVDRYLQENKTVGRNTLQLVGTSALYVASKYEEMYSPELEDFVYICDDIFSKRQILTMEQDILRKLDFSLGRPLSIHFLRRYNKIAQAKGDHHTLGKYILELALLEYNMAHVKPSIQAAAACCLSIGILNEVMDLTKIWTPTLVHYTTYKFIDFRSVIIDMAHLLVNAETSRYQTVRKKYGTAAFAKMSLNSKLNGPLIRKLTATKK